MFEIKKAILISNILDPLSKNDDDLKIVYDRIFSERKYEAIETRPISIAYTEPFNKQRPMDITTTYYLTGDLSRAHLSLCTADEANRTQALTKCKQALKQAEKTNCTYLGIGSGAIEDNALLNLDCFIRSLCELFEYIHQEHLSIKLAIEPLDQYAHKKNVIGSLDMTLRMIRALEAAGYDERNYILTWDAAHVALNEDDFETSIQALSKYIYKVHFANAILDKHDPLYGDHHMDFNGGFMNVTVASSILNFCQKYIDHPIEVACEIREKDRVNCWQREAETYQFICDAIEAMQ